ncbi:MAG: hypothetical protein KBS94_05390 [Prevotella sp.]|nr:hypothetical protein [Candidatus Equicola faecalis]
MKKRLFIALCILAINSMASKVLAFTAITSGIAAFPGAEGYGKYTTGGRGGTVFYVTRNDDCSDSKLVPGTLRWALAADNGGKPRTILFNTCGTIYLTSKLRTNKDNITIEGQTAPGGGVCLAGYNLYINSSNVIVRHLRFRAGDIPSKSMCGIDMENGTNVILDHCSITWSMEECLTAYDTNYTTVQWCIIGESLYNSKNSKGARAYATQWGGEYSTMHHSLITNSNSRSPRFNGARGTNDQYVNSEFVNNVVFNWGSSGAQYGGENDKSKTGIDDSYDRVYLVNNFYRPGPATKKNVSGSRYFCSPSQPYGEWYLNGNKFEVDGEYSTKSGVWSKSNLDAVNADNYYGAQAGNSARAINLTGDNFTKYVLQSFPTQWSGYEAEDAESAYHKTVQQAGATLPRIDEVDQRILAQAAGTDNNFASGDRGNGLGIIDSPDNLSLDEHDTYYAKDDKGNGAVYTNYPFIGMRKGDKYAKDTDGDGMPDGYETERGLNPNNPADGATITTSGYSNLELYLNGIADGTINKTDYETEEYTVTIPANMTNYEDGKTLSGWLNGNDGKIYVPMQTYNTPVEITYDAPIYNTNKKKIADRTTDISVVWDFKKEGAPSVTGEGIFVTQTNVDDEKQDVKLDFNNSVITIPWYDKAKLKINGLAVTPSIDGAKASFPVEASSLNSIVLNIPKIVPLYTEKAVINTSFQDWRYIDSNDTVHINTDFSDEMIIFSTYNTTVDSAATNPGKFDPETDPDFKGYALAAKSASTFSTSKFQNITKVRFYEGATGNDRGWGLRKKGAKDTDWVTLYNTRINGTPQWIEVNVNDEDVELQWWNLNEEQNAYMFHLEVYSMVENTAEQVTLTTDVNPSNAGTISREPDAETYDINSKVTVTANAADGYLFVHWTDDYDNILSTSRIYTHQLTEDTHLTAVFSDGSHIFSDGPYNAIVKNGDELMFALSAAKKATKSIENPYRIFLHNGTYDLGKKAKTELTSFVSLIGESMEGVIIMNNPGSVTSGYQDNTPTLFIDSSSSDIYLQDVTIRQARDWDTKKSTGQAIAMRQRGKRVTYKKVCMQGIQDTYYLNKADATAYLEDCSLYGQTDFIYGDGTAFLQKCYIYNTGAGYITAPNTQLGYKGIIFNECVVDGAESVSGKFYLGRPWGDSPAATYLNTTFLKLPQNTGWGSMTSGLVCRLHEYNSKDATGAQIDLSQRSIEACSPAQGSDACVINETQAQDYAYEKVVTAWDARSLTAQMLAPTGVKLNEATGVLSWDNSSAYCWAILKDGNVIDFTTTPYYTISTPGDYTIRAANGMGGLGEESSSVTSISDLQSTTNDQRSTATYNLRGEKVTNKQGATANHRQVLITDGRKYLQ